MRLIISLWNGSTLILEPGKSITLFGCIELELASVEVLAASLKMTERQLRTTEVLGKRDYWPRFRFQAVPLPDNFWILEKGYSRPAVPSQYWQWHLLHPETLGFAIQDDDGPEESFTISVED